MPGYRYRRYRSSGGYRPSFRKNSGSGDVDGDDDKVRDTMQRDPAAVQDELDLARRLSSIARSTPMTPPPSPAPPASNEKAPSEEPPKSS